MLNVLFARPHDFDGPVDVFADANGGRHHVGFEPAAEAAAKEMVVRGDFLERQARGFRCVRLRAGDNLAADPHFAAIGSDMNRAVQWLHRRVRQERYLVFRIEPVTLWCGGLNQHQPCRSARHAQRFPERANGIGIAGNLNAESWIGVELLVGRGMLQHDLAEICVPCGITRVV